METQFKQDKGVAGLTILLSLIVMLFVIGLLIMIFSLMGGEVEDATYDDLTTSIANETVGVPMGLGGQFVSYNSKNTPVCTIHACLNVTGTNIIVPTADYDGTSTNCKVKALVNTTANNFSGTSWKCSYTVVYKETNTATETMNDTITGLSGTTDWFDIFIVIGAMVVLILLTVIIITSIRSSGMIAGAGSTKGASQVGTA